MTDAQVAELITRRRRQVLVHSVIYYRLNDNIISDDQWAKWALELEELQARHPEIAEQCPYAAAFRGFDHSTGMSLPLEDKWAMKEAQLLLDWRKRK